MHDSGSHAYQERRGFWNNRIDSPGLLVASICTYAKFRVQRPELHSFENFTFGNVRGGGVGGEGGIPASNE